MLDTLNADLKSMKDDLDRVIELARKEGDRHRGEDGKLINSQIKKSLSELKGQSDDSRGVEESEHTVELTPMELFAVGAEKDMKNAFEKADEMKIKFSSTLEYFGEDAKMSSSDFFGTLNKFINAFGISTDFVEKQEQTRVRLFL